MPPSPSDDFLADLRQVMEILDYSDKVINNAVAAGEIAIRKEKHGDDIHEKKYHSLSSVLVFARRKKRKVSLQALYRVTRDPEITADYEAWNTFLEGEGSRGEPIQEHFQPPSKVVSNDEGEKEQMRDRIKEKDKEIADLKGRNDTLSGKYEALLITSSNESKMLIMQRGGMEKALADVMHKVQLAEPMLRISPERDSRGVIVDVKVTKVLPARRWWLRITFLVILLGVLGATVVYSLPNLF